MDVSVPDMFRTAENTDLSAVNDDENDEAEGEEDDDEEDEDVEEMEARAEAIRCLDEVILERKQGESLDAVKLLKRGWERAVSERKAKRKVGRKEAREAQAIVRAHIKAMEAAAKAGRDPVDDLALTFCFQGAPGTGKTTVARRMGLLFEALGVLPSADVVQVSASQFSTGFVGQTAAQTRDIFDSARGAVLFIDEAYRLYDPAGRSYMQEAIDEIVNLLTEEQYRGKMAVIFAGYSGQMSDMLDKVNPGLKSRVSDVIDFPDFSGGAAAEMAALQLAARRLKVGGERAASLEPWTERLAAAPRWANGRDVETFVRRVAVECATRKTSEVTAEVLEAALATVLQMKGPSTSAAPAL